MSFASLLLSFAVAVGAGLSARYAYQAAKAGQISAAAANESALQAKQQTVIAQEQLAQGKRASRPYVIAQISRDQVTEGLTDGSDPAFTHEYVARLRFTNFGTTPAIIKNIKGIVTLVLPYRVPPLNEEHATELILAQGMSTKEYVLIGRSNSQEAMNLRVGSGSSVYISGSVLYSDVAGQDMSTEFCYIWPLHSHDPRTQLVQHFGPGCSNQRN